MREPTREEKERLRAKIQEERRRKHEIVMETARESDEKDKSIVFGVWKHRMGRGVIMPLVMKIPGLSFRGKLILGLLLRILLSIIALVVIAVISLLVSKS